MTADLVHFFLLVSAFCSIKTEKRFELCYFTFSLFFYFNGLIVIQIIHCEMFSKTLHKNNVADRNLYFMKWFALDIALNIIMLCEWNA